MRIAVAKGHWPAASGILERSHQPCKVYSGNFLGIPGKLHRVSAEVMAGVPSVPRLLA